MSDERSHPRRCHIRVCRGESEFRSASALFREYAASLAFSLEYQGFDAEVASLPGAYAPPGGCILLAWESGGPGGGAELAVGCAAIRPLVDDICEMKRMFVRPGSRKAGIGRDLAQRLILEARRAGYRTMRLDSSRDFAPALSLYSSLGFRFIERYNDDTLPDTVFMELALDSAPL